MGRAFFVGLSAAFMTAYALIADALGLGSGDVGFDPVEVPESPDRGGWDGFIDGVLASFSYAFDLMETFFQLLTFQAAGQETASVITLMIFVPLGFINAYIIFTAVRGS